MDVRDEERQCLQVLEGKKGQQGDQIETFGKITSLHIDSAVSSVGDTVITT